MGGMANRWKKIQAPCWVISKQRGKLLIEHVMFFISTFLIRNILKLRIFLLKINFYISTMWKNIYIF